MFARPRPKRNILTAPSKKRKNTHTIEEISFDTNARSEYLTGFHKRKLQRVKNAQEQAAQRARQEKIDARRQMRENRRREVEEHVKTVQELLRTADRAGGVDSEDEDGNVNNNNNEEWGGLPDAPVALEAVDHEEEFIDEDKYTSVTVESVSVSRDGLYKPEEEQAAADEEERKANESRRAAQGKVERPKKTKKPKFRYESKAERALGARKLKAKKRTKANERRE